MRWRGSGRARALTSMGPWVVSALLLIGGALLGGFTAGCGGPGRATLTTGDPFYDPLPRKRSRPKRAKKAPRRKPKKNRVARRASRSGKRGKVAERCDAILPIARRVSGRQSIDLGLVMGIIRVESRYTETIKNRRTGASGLMQVMPGTGRHFKCGDLLDATDNITCGVRVLKRYLAIFDGNMTYGVSAYHAGPVHPKRARKRGRLPKNFSYVQKVMKARTRFLRRGCY